MSRQHSALSPLVIAPHDRSKPTAWHLFSEIVLPAAGVVIFMTLMAIALPTLNIFEIGLMGVLGILTHALWHSPEEALKQLKFGAQAFVIAGVLSIVPAHAVSAFMGNGGLFSPAEQLSMVELSLEMGLIFSVLLTFYYWVIFAIWDNRYDTMPQYLWLTVFSASLLIFSIQIVLTWVSGGLLALLLSLLIPVLMFFPPMLWMMTLDQDG